MGGLSYSVVCGLRFKKLKSYFYTVVGEPGVVDLPEQAAGCRFWYPAHAVSTFRSTACWRTGPGCDVYVVRGDLETAAWPEWDEGLVGFYPDLLHYHRVPTPEMDRRLLLARLFPRRNRVREQAIRLWIKMEDIPDPQRRWVDRGPGRPI